MKARAKEAPSINLHFEKYIRMLQMLETQLRRNKKGQLRRNKKGNSPIKKETLYSTTLPRVSPL